MKHTTRYYYSSEVSFSRNELRLKPRESDDQSVRLFSLNVDPNADLRQRFDFYDNCVHVCKIINPHDELIIHSESKIRTHPKNKKPVARFNDLEINDPDLQEFLLPTEFVPLDNDWCETFNFPKASPGTKVGNYLKTLMGSLKNEFEYNASATDVGTTIPEFARHKRGVCQDFAHSLLAVCRQQNLPARYVSGYIKTGKGSHASHAWLEVYTPDEGWVGIDPTNNQFVNEKYVAVAYGRDYEDCAPVSGIRRGGGLDKMQIEVNVTETETQSEPREQTVE